MARLNVMCRRTAALSLGLLLFIDGGGSFANAVGPDNVPPAPDAGKASTPKSESDRAQTDPAKLAEAEKAIAATRRLLEFGASNEAEIRLRQALNRIPSSVSLLRLATEITRDERGDVVASLKYAQRWAELAPTDAEAHLAVSYAAFGLGGRPVDRTDPTFNEQVKIAEEMTALSRIHAQKALTLGGAAVASARFRLGEIDRYAAIELAALDRSAVGEVARLRESALAHYAAAREADPQFAEGLLPAAEVAVALQRSVEALKFVADHDTLAGKISFSGEEIRAQAALLVPDLTAFASAAANLRALSDTNENRILASIAARVKDWKPRSTESEPPKGPRLDRATALAVIDAVKLLNQVSAGQERIRLLRPFIPVGDRNNDTTTPIVPEFCYLAADAYHGLGRSQASAKDADVLYTEALRMLDSTGLNAEAYAALEGTVPDVSRLRAFVCLGLRLYDKAGAAFKRTAELDKLDTRAPLYASALPDIAAGHYDAADFETFLSLRESRMPEGDRVKHLRAFAERKPRFATLHTFLGALLYDRSDISNARACYEKAVAVHKDYSEALYGLARSETRLGLWKEAEEHLDALAKIAPSYRESVELRGYVKRVTTGALNGEALAKYFASLPESLKDEPRALILDEVIAKAPRFCEALIDRAATAVRLAELKLAAALAKRALEAADSDGARSRAHAVAADCAARDADVAGAVGHYKLARDLETVDDVRRASLDHLLATMQFVSGDHSGADATMRASMRRRAPATGEAAAPGGVVWQMPATMLPSRNALERIDTPRERSEVVTAFNPGVRIGQSLVMRAALRVAREGGSNPQEDTAECDVRLGIDATPTVGGLYVVKVAFEGVPDKGEWAALRDVGFTIKFSPWFGPAEAPKIEKEAARTPADLVLQALTELFCLAPGTGELPANKPWNRSGLAGVLHLESDHEVAWAETVTPERTVLRRMAIGDFFDEFDPRVTWKPRQRVDARLELEGAQRFPKQVSVALRRSGLTAAKDDVETQIYSAVLTRKD